MSLLSFSARSHRNSCRLNCNCNWYCNIVCVLLDVLIKFMNVHQNEWMRSELSCGGFVYSCCCTSAAQRTSIVSWEIWTSLRLTCPACGRSVRNAAVTRHCQVLLAAYHLRTTSSSIWSVSDSTFSSVSPLKLSVDWVYNAFPVFCQYCSVSLLCIVFI